MIANVIFIINNNQINYCYTHQPPPAIYLRKELVIHKMINFFYSLYFIVRMSKTDGTQAQHDHPLIVCWFRSTQTSRPEGDLQKTSRCF